MSRLGRRFTTEASARVPREWVGLILLGLLPLPVWGLALLVVPYGQVGDTGLVSVLPVWAYLAFVPLAAAFALLLRRPAFPTAVALGLTLVLIAILYGTSPLLSGEPRIASAWRHLGVIDYILRNGQVDPSVDVYHNWPGFFVLVASVAQAAGITDLRPVALWAPLWQSLLYLPALHVLAGSLADDRRVVWLAIWLFYSANWIGQDYLSPQALGFFLYLVLVTLFVRWLAARDRQLPGLPGIMSEEASASRARPGWAAGLPVRLAVGLVSLGQRLIARRPARAAQLPGPAVAALAAVIVIVFGFTVSAHQLTPFFLLTATTALLVVFRLRWVVLVPLMGVMTGAWAIFFAVPYLSGHLQQIATYVGLGDGLTANLTNRLGGSPGHQAVVFARLVMTGAIWLLAAAGVLRRLATGRWDVTAVALAAAPFPMFALQSYGGEMLLRITLFSLPFAALLTAFLVFPRRTPAGRQATVAVFLMTLVLLGTFMLARYGNERLETFTPDEVAAVDVLYEEAPAGSLMLGITGNIPWKSTRYEEYRYRPVGDATFFGDADQLLQVAGEYGGPVYLIVTRAQKASVEMLQGAPDGAFDAFVAELLAGNRFQPIYRNPDAIVARYVAGQGTP